MSAPARPTSITVLAIVNFLFGVWAILAALSAALYPLMMKLMRTFLAQMPPFPSRGGANPMAVFNAMLEVYERPWVIAWMVTAGVLQLVIGGGLIASGAGLLMLRRWGRTTALVASTSYFVVGVAGLVVGVYLNVLIMEALRNANVPQQAVGTMIGMAFGMVIVVLLPGLNYFLLFRPEARAALDGNPQQTLAKTFE